MKTDQLIDSLASRLEPARAFPLARTVAAFLIPGAAVSALWMQGWLGVRPDLASAAMTGPFWMKFAYTAALAALGLAAVMRAALPGGKGGLRLLGMAGVAVLLGCFALVQWFGAPPDARPALLSGHTVAVCWERIVLLSLPLLAGLLLAMRRLAPTRLRWAGFAAGLAAGGAGSLVYSFHCDESAAVFVAVWYTAGVLLTGLIGLLAGPLLLRWR